MWLKQPRASRFPSYSLTPGKVSALIGLGPTFDVNGVRRAVYSFGSGEKGQLGNGRTGEHITTGNKTGFDSQSEPR